jgi:hypothetical protein
MTDTTMEMGTFRLAGVFQKAFAIYGRRFVPLVILTLIASVPGYITLFLFPFPDMSGGVDPDTLITFGYAVGTMLLMMIVTGALAGGAVIYGVVQDLRGRPFSVSESLLVALRRLLPLIGVGFCVGILVVIGVILLVVPGCILLSMLLVSTHACVVERTGVFASMSRSRTLTRGHRWKVFGMVVLLAIVIGILSTVVGAVFSLAGPYASLIATQAFNLIAGAFDSVLFTVLYFQLRVAKEGVDIDKIASVFD